MRIAIHSVSLLEKRSSLRVLRTPAAGAEANSAAILVERRAGRPGSVGRRRWSSGLGCLSVTLARDGINVASAPLSRHIANALLGNRTCSIVFSISCLTRSADNLERWGALSTI